MTTSCLKKILVLLIVNSFGVLYAQDQSLADSLELIYKQLDVNDTSRFELLKEIANNQNDPRLKLQYASKLIEEAKKVKDLRYLHHGYVNEGQAYRLQGDFDVAIYSLFKALAIAEEDNYEPGIAAANTALADVHSVVGNHGNSILYYKEALKWISDEDSTLLAIILLNMGDEYYLSSMYDSALASFRNSMAIYESLGDDQSGLAYNEGNIGLVQAEIGNLKEAEANIRNAIESLESLGDHYGSAIFLSYLAEIYKKKQYLIQAKVLADSSMRISRKYGLKAEIRDNSRRLAEIYAMSSDYETAYKYHQEYVELKDSISNDEILSRMENMESAFELAEKQSEVELLTAEQEYQSTVINATIIISVILVILAVVILMYYRNKARTNAVLEMQKKKLEELNQTKDKFFSIISHDLRGPINSFHGVSNLIKYFVQAKDMDQLLEVADDIDKSVDRITNLLNNLLSWAMQQQGSFPNVPEKVDLNELAQELVETLDNMARGKNIELDARIDEQIFLWADKNSAMTILRNLVNNSLKFTNPGGKVGIAAVAKSGFAEIKIYDTGLGISTEKLKLLSEDKDLSSSYGTDGERGLGLGLQLVYEFVEMNKGKIKVESAEGIGTTFTIYLPLFEEVGEKISV
ncbi:MAG: hypothetical protein CMB80_19735 [Flammeovirgaceae bacterium]|nr:hypothetical protein [Flammeovirgaceae bacterium]MBE61552.1 hypothetical protein [Flammeovirgaceae bacterium]MBR10365.1 hypothetical protein [Rickettsiales bacterium]